MEEVRNTIESRLDPSNPSMCLDVYSYPFSSLLCCACCGGVDHRTYARLLLAKLKSERRTSMLLLILVLLLLFGGGGGYYGYSRWGSGGGLGIVGTVVLIALILYFLGVLR
jgi:hypothetical protein